MERLDALAVPQLHGESAVVDHGVVRQVEALVLAEDGVVRAHLVKPRGVQVGLDLHQLLVVELARNLAIRDEVWPLPGLTLLLENPVFSLLLSGTRYLNAEQCFPLFF